MNSNEHLYIYIELEEEMKLMDKQRFILREASKTIGFGYVLFI